MDRLIVVDEGIDERFVRPAAVGPYIVVNLCAAVALLPHQPSLPFPTYFLIAIEGMVRQIDSAAWNKDGTICVLWRDETKETFFDYLLPDARVEIHQVWQ